jgi:hypothetical protein
LFSATQATLDDNQARGWVETLEIIRVAGDDVLSLAPGTDDDVSVGDVGRATGRKQYAHAGRVRTSPLAASRTPAALWIDGTSCEAGRGEIAQFPAVYGTESRRRASQRSVFAAQRDSDAECELRR